MYIYIIKIPACVFLKYIEEKVWGKGNRWKKERKNRGWNRGKEGIKMQIYIPLRMILMSSIFTPLCVFESFSLHVQI